MGKGTRARGKKEELCVPTYTFDADIEEYFKRSRRRATREFFSPKFKEVHRRVRRRDGASEDGDGESEEAGEVGREGEGKEGSGVEEKGEEGGYGLWGADGWKEWSWSVLKEPVWVVASKGDGSGSGDRDADAEVESEEDEEDEDEDEDWEDVDGDGDVSMR